MDVSVEISVTSEGVKRTQIVAPSLKEQDVGVEIYSLILPLIEQIDKTVRSNMKMYKRQS